MKLKKLILSSRFINGILVESSPRNRIPWEFFQSFNRIKDSITFAVIIVIHKSRNLIGTLGSWEFGLE